MCSHVAIINHGQIGAAGTLEEVAQGKELEDRFIEIIGGHRHDHISWLKSDMTAVEDTPTA